jgi:small subunit ribosomal protein S4
LPGPGARRVSSSPHGHFLVNGQRVDVPSYRVEQYDIITVRKQSKETFPFELGAGDLRRSSDPGLAQGRPGIA